MVNSPAPVCSTHCTPGPDRLPFTWANQSVHGLGKWYAKFRTGNFVPESCLLFVQISFSFSEKRPRRREDGVKDDFEKMEHEFPFGTFRPEKQDYLFRCSVALGNLPLKRPDPKSRVPFNQPDFPETFCKW